MQICGGKCISHLTIANALVATALTGSPTQLNKGARALAVEPREKENEGSRGWDTASLTAPRHQVYLPAAEGIAGSSTKTL